MTNSSPFSTTELTLAEVITFVDSDLPDWRWSLAHCKCGHADGPYVAMMITTDFQPPQPAIDIIRGEFVWTEQEGHRNVYHATTPAAALSKCYAKAMSTNTAS